MTIGERLALMKEVEKRNAESIRRFLNKTA